MAHGDRFIPLRQSEKWHAKYAVDPEEYENCVKAAKSSDANENSTDHSTYISLLRNELLDEKLHCVRRYSDEHKSPPLRKIENMFEFSPKKRKSGGFQESTEVQPQFTLSPVSAKSHKLLTCEKRPPRKISRMPYKVLDAPDLEDDFYLNVVDWSSRDVIAVGLGSSVYLWSAKNSEVTRLCDVAADGVAVRSVAWNARGNYLAVGTHSGLVSVWDVEAGQEAWRCEGHTQRVGALSWSGGVLCSGGRDRLILQHEGRAPGPQRRLRGHRQEVCGLRWAPALPLLASGGNDNRVLLWGLRSPQPLRALGPHAAAVKALAWSPQERGLLATGGGTADRTLRFWNALTGQLKASVDTGSQVCNLAWSAQGEELVSTHGYSHHEVALWSFPALRLEAALTGHTSRVLYLAAAPDGRSVVTGAGDETLRFWSVFRPRGPRIARRPLCASIR